jgi:hypothetical protein
MERDFPENLRALSRLMQSWSGTPLDAAGILRRLNDHGSRPPLFWIFNAMREPERLAAALGPDQPLIYGRSLHMIVPPGPDRRPVQRALAAYYADALTGCVGAGPLWVGANCQGAAIAADIARRLNAGGPVVPALALINGRPDGLPDLPGLLIYGSEDPQNDPFRDGTDPPPRLGPLALREVLPRVAHGGYFEPGTVERVAARLRTYFDSVPAVSAASAAAS